MEKTKYVTTEFEAGAIENASKEELIDVVRLGHENRTIDLTKTYLKMVEKYFHPWPWCK